MKIASLLSIQVGLPKKYDADTIDERWTSAIAKTPVSGKVWLSKTQLEGDGQADLKNHGGPDKAVLAYGEAHYTAWRSELGLSDLPHGAFGENFTMLGLTEENVCIGDTYKIGEVVVQVSQPRIPCWKLSRLWNVEDLDGRVKKSGKTGWYLRVIEEGNVKAGVPVILVDRPYPEWTIARANDILAKRNQEQSDIAELTRVPLLASGMRNMLKSRLAK